MSIELLILKRQRSIALTPQEHEKLQEWDNRFEALDDRAIEDLSKDPNCLDLATRREIDPIASRKWRKLRWHIFLKRFLNLFRLKI